MAKEEKRNQKIFTLMKLQAENFENVLKKKCYTVIFDIPFCLSG